nr:hypothetical protein [Tanacetum cinerariifolium]
MSEQQEQEVQGYQIDLGNLMAYDPQYHFQSIPEKKVAPYNCVGFDNKESITEMRIRLYWCTTLREDLVKEYITHATKLIKSVDDSLFSLPSTEDQSGPVEKMHFLLTTLKVVYVLTTLMPELLEDATVEAIRIRAKWENDDYICRGYILNGFKHTLKHGKDDLSLIQLGSHLCIEGSLRARESDKGKGIEVSGPSFNMTKEDKNKHNKQNKGVVRLVTLKRIAKVVKRTTQMLVVREKGLRTIHKTKVDAIAWWIDSGATTHVCKDRCAMVRLPDLKRKTLVKMVLIASLLDMLSIPRHIDDHTNDVPNEIPEAKKEDPRTYNEAMQSRDAAFWKEATDDGIVDKTKKFLSSRFSMKDMGEADVILGIKIKRENKRNVITQSHYIEKILKKFNHEDCSSMSTPMDPVEKLKPNTGKPIDQLEYSRAIGCLMYDMTSPRPDIAYAVGRLSRYLSVLEGYSDASWINHVEDSASTTLAAVSKEAEWLRNLINEIPIWLKPIAPISIRCDSAPMDARTYSQIYNGKSRHLGARSKGTTYVNMKFSCFMKLELSFLYVY